MLFLYLLGYLMAWPVQFIYFKKKIYYEDRKNQGRTIKGGAIIVSNHRSFKDYMMYMYVFYFRKMYCLMSELIYKKGRLLAFLVTCLGGIKVDRFSFDMSFIGKSVDLLERKKKCIVIFPEAKINKEKRLQRFTTSYILMALRANVPIIPVYTLGKYGLFRRSRMAIGKKIYLSDYCNNPNPTKEELEYLNNIVKNKILDLEKMVKERMLIEEYGKAFSLKKFTFDLGRLLVFIMNIHFRVKVINKKNKKIKGGYIVVANHSMFKDPLLLINAFKNRRIRILAAEIVFDGHKLRSHLMKKMGIIRIDRTKYDIDAVTKCIDVLKGHGVLVVFPEGQIDRENGVKQFKSGAAFMAQQANVPILPAFIENKRRHARFRVHIGEAIDTSAICTNKYSTVELEKLSETIFDSIKKLEESVVVKHE
ncbi:MAG: 1-acyl-sn-glycerol-3-phosphate acyltransferase [bacterium]|nr:1-acyl-sn-glycerol-3-phosphate acyltransferase [bacterium]